MPTSFQNMATLTYTGGTVNSNIVTGELREVLTAAKRRCGRITSLAGRSRMWSALPTAASRP